MSDVDSRIREEFVALDPLPPGAEGDWHDVLNRLDPPRRRRGWVLATAAVAVAVAAAAVAALVLLPTGGGGPSAAAAALDRLATAAAAHSLAPKPGQYLYSGSEGKQAAFLVGRHGSCETLHVYRRETWIGTDGSGLIRETWEPGVFTSPADRAVCLGMERRYGKHSGVQFELSRQGGNQWFAPQCLSLKPRNDFDWSSLSSDPQVALRQIIPSGDARSGPAEEFSLIEEFLHETDAPPDARAKLLRAVGAIPGIELLGTVRDHAGRSGVGFSLPRHGELIFDPKTAQLLSEQGTGEAPQSWTVYLRQKVVDGLPGKAPGPLTPPCKNGSGVNHSVKGGSVTNGAPR
jgi:hypothetical protein